MTAKSQCGNKAVLDGPIPLLDSPDLAKWSKVIAPPSRSRGHCTVVTVFLYLDIKTMYSDT